MLTENNTGDVFQKTHFESRVSTIFSRISSSQIFYFFKTRGKIRLKIVETLYSKWVFWKTSPVLFLLPRFISLNHITWWFLDTDRTCKFTIDDFQFSVCMRIQFIWLSWAISCIRIACNINIWVNPYWCEWFQNSIDKKFLYINLKIEFELHQ